MEMIASIRGGKKNALNNIEALNSLQKDLAHGTDDPLLASYLSVFGLVSTCMYDLAKTKELKDFDKIARKYQDIYMPSFPPMSPHTDSYYVMWELLDLAFGPSKETLCGVFLELVDILKISELEIDIIKKLSRSYIWFVVKTKEKFN